MCFGGDVVVCCSVYCRRCFGHDGAHVSDESHLQAVVHAFVSSGDIDIDIRIIPNIIHPCTHIYTCFLVQLPSYAGCPKSVIPRHFTFHRHRCGPVSTDVRAVSDGPWKLAREDGYFLIIACVLCSSLADISDVQTAGSENNRKDSRPWICHAFD